MFTRTAPALRSLPGALILATCLSCVTQVVQAPSPDVVAAASDDPPGRVGRLSLIAGNLSIRAAGDSEWAAATPNRPVTTGDALWSENGSRAEVDVGSAVMRLGSETQLDVERLDDQVIQVSVPQGSAILHVRALAAGETDEIDAPNAAIGFGTAGEYRVDVSPNGLTTTITVFSGAAQVSAGGASFPVNAPQVATVHGDQAATYSLAYVGAPDDFDQWSRSRDAVEVAAEAGSLNYVSPDMPGIADLAANGQWEQDAAEGAIWYPSAVPAGWAPYRDGHWVWVGRWGWTWVDDAPWGWAPFHYGRWAYVRGRWGWSPGRAIGRPVYAPALVVFVGGNGWNPSRFGDNGGVGWFPLAPREAYRPPYAASQGYVQRVNVTNVTNVTNITNVTNVTNITYRNRSVANAVTTVSQTTFANGAPVSRGLVRVPPREINRAPVLGHAPVVPTRVSLVGEEDTGRHAALPPAALQHRPVVAAHVPPPAPLPFSVQEHTLAVTQGKPLTESQMEQLRHQLPPATTPVRVRSASTFVEGGAPLRPAQEGPPDVHPVAAAQPVPPAIERVPVTRMPVASVRQPATTIERVPVAPAQANTEAPAMRASTVKSGRATKLAKSARAAKRAQPGTGAKSVKDAKPARDGTPAESADPASKPMPRRQAPDEPRP